MIVKKYITGSIVQRFDTNTGECLDIDFIPDEQDLIFEDEDCFQLHPSGVYIKHLEKVFNKTRLVSQEEYNKLLNLYAGWYFYLDHEEELSEN